MLQHPQFTLTVLDPTSLLGNEVVAALWQAFPAARRRFFHTTGVDEHLLAEVGGEPALVPPLGEGDELDGSDVVVATATPTEAAATRLVAWLRANAGAVLIDCTQPGLAPAESESVLTAPPPGKSERRWFHLADPAMWAPGRVLQALAPLDPREVHLTVLLPVSDFGQPGVQELAKQAAARLSGQPTRRSDALPCVLAFDAAPATGVRREVLQAQLHSLFPGLAMHLAAIQVGIFYGHAAALSVRTEARVDAARVTALIRKSPEVRIAQRNERPQPSAAVDSAEIVCSDIRCEDHRVALWLVADGLRVGAVQVVVDVVSAVRAS